MGFDPGTMALLSGVSTGFAGFMGGQSQSEAAQQNAAINRQYAILAKERSVNDILTIRAEEVRQKARQSRTNEAVLGNAIAVISGASGVSMEGSTADAMSNLVEIAWSKLQEIGAQSLKQQTTALNRGNAEVYKYTTNAMTYDQQASAAESASWMSLATGVVGGVAGALGANENYFDGAEAETAASTSGAPVGGLLGDDGKVSSTWADYYKTLPFRETLLTPWNSITGYTEDDATVDYNDLLRIGGT
jgi:hypothetical protein